MNSPRPRLRTWVALGALTTLLGTPPAAASDHADPADPLMFRRIDGTLTGLFAFPTKGLSRVVADLKMGKWRPLIDPNEGDGLTLILCIHRSLATPPPYPGTEEYTFKIFLDWESEIRVSYPRKGTPPGPDEQATARYGGVVVRPEEIRENAVITMRLDKSSRFTERSAVILKKDGAQTIPLTDEDWYSGVRDDPFIFPQFFSTNVIAMAVHIPYDYLPAGRDDLAIWATSERHGSQIDIVGRAQRTQLPRLDLLNTIHPSEHVKALMQARDSPGLMQDIASYLIPTEFRLRSFDFQPDVMVFSKRFPSGYPNGRRLEDDVAKLACEQGDCQLYEMSFTKPRTTASETHSRYIGGRPTANDRPFSDEFPYLAEPWPDPVPPPPPALTMKNKMILILLGLFVAAVVLLPWFLYFRSVRRYKVRARRGSTVTVS